MTLLSKIRESYDEVKKSRPILFALIRRDLVGRYKNSLLGFAWHFIIPIMMIIVYYVIFSEARRSTIDNYVIYLSSGMFIFSFMISNLVGGTACISSNSNMIKKMSFPREIIVLSQVISSFIVMAIAYSAVFGLLIILNYPINAESILFVPVLLVLAFLFVLGYVFALSALNAYHRDVQLFLSSISIAFYFITPIFFTTDEMTDVMEAVVWFNPFSYYVEGFHSSIYYGTIPDLRIMVVCTILSVASVVVGYAIFRKLQFGFVERL